MSFQFEDLIKEMQRTTHVNIIFRCETCGFAHYPLTLELNETFDIDIEFPMQISTLGYHVAVSVKL